MNIGMFTLKITHLLLVTPLMKKFQIIANEAVKLSKSIKFALHDIPHITIVIITKVPSFLLECRGKAVHTYDRYSIEAPKLYVSRWRAPNLYKVDNTYCEDNIMLLWLGSLIVSSLQSEDLLYKYLSKINFLYNWSTWRLCNKHQRIKLRIYLSRGIKYLPTWRLINWHLRRMRFVQE